MSIMKRIFFFNIWRDIKQLFSQEFKGKFKAVPPKQGVSKAAIPQIPGPPKVKPYVADVIPENTFKIPKMMLSSRQRFIEETKI
jgi:hypothetical protein